MKSATTPDERKAAGKEFHEAMKQALLKADPSLATVLEQLNPPQGPPTSCPGQCPPGTPPQKN